MRRRPIRFLPSLVVAAALSACAVPRPAGGDAAVVKVIAFNDFHGTLESPGNFGAHTAVPPAQRPAVGGADALAAHVALLKARSRYSVVVAAGDLVGASPLVSSLFHDEPAVEALNRIGLEFSAVGNHEFDHGAAELLRLQNGGCPRSGDAGDRNSCRGLGTDAPGRFGGASFQWLSANVRHASTGRPLLPAYGVKRFGGVDVAFIGMTLEGTPRIVAPTGVAGLAFEDEADTVNALVPELRARGIEAVVVLLHEGGVQAAADPPRAALADINGCDGDLQPADGSASAIRAIVARLDDAVDLVISGHTHAAYNCSAARPTCA